VYDASKARHVLRFFRKVLGIKLPPWQVKLLSDVFGTVREDGRRQYRLVYVEVPGQNGKSLLLGGLGLYLLLYGGEEHNVVYSTAASKDQALNIFRNSLDYVQQSKVLSSILKPLPATKHIQRRGDLLSFFRAIAADGKRGDGVHGHVLTDELHRWHTANQLELWGVIKKASMSLREPLRTVISTAGSLDESPLCLPLHNKALAILRGEEQDDTFYPMVFGLDQSEDWHDENNWIKVNPSLQENGGFLELESLRSLYREARGNPVAEHQFRRLHLNTWLSGNIENVIKPDDWKLNQAPVRDDLTDRPCYLALDLAHVHDLASLVAIWPDYEDGTYDLRVWCWKPSDSLKQASIKDRVPYEKWAQEGWLTISDGPIISSADIVTTIKELVSSYDVREIAIDPYHAAEVRYQLHQEGLTVIDHRQVMMNMTMPTKKLLADIKLGKFRTDSNPLLSWAASCLSLVSDSNGNVRPSKPDIRKTNSRIDPIVAAIMALDRAVRNGYDPQPYAEHGVTFVNLT
jgi:phage terminase large subunit-like protein